jgi:hypothetical protein
MDDKTFESAVLPVVERYARKFFGRDEERVSVALVLAWWSWRQSPGHCPSTYAHFAVRHVGAQRDLPGLRARCSDVWRRLTRFQGAGMDQVADPRPGPDALAAQRELYALLRDKLNGQELRLHDLTTNGVTRTDAIAAEMGVTSRRVSQIRRQVMQKHQALE